jgi:MFS family permease
MQRVISLTRQELRVVAALASIFSLRMLGLCMLLPVFALEASKFPAASAQLIGLAVGIYGLAQAFLQIPFGILSDKYGRRPLILFGLGLLLLGSLICACATSIYGLILGRVLQGSGAIGSVVIATLIDNTREEIRTRCMAVLGISIGLAFVSAMILGPWLTLQLGLQGIFWVTAALAGGGIILLLLTIPKNAAWKHADDMASSRHNLSDLNFNYKLMTLNYGIFALHASLAALFLVLPLLIQQAGFAAGQLWKLYAVSLVAAMVLSLNFITQAERRKKIDSLQLLAIGGLLLAEGLLSVVSQQESIVGVLILFFAAFCVLEAVLPTLVSRYAPVKNRGAALGVYSSLQFLGIFFGGIMGGWLHGRFGITAVLSLCMLLAVTWLGVTLWGRRYKLDFVDLKIS